MIKIFRTAATAALMIVAVQSCTAQQSKVVVNREVETTNEGKMLLGKQSMDQFTKAPYGEWYTKEHDEYAIDEEAVAELKKNRINSYNILAFVGTWCEDSHTHFPRLMKILETVKYPEERLTVIALNRKKESPDGDEGLHNIQKVPTFIVTKYGKEVGRITETPMSGWLERDLLEILKKNDTSVKDLFKKAE